MREVQVFHCIPTLIFGFYSPGIKNFYFLIMSFKQEEKNNCGSKTALLGGSMGADKGEKLTFRERRFLSNG